MTDQIESNQNEELLDQIHSEEIAVEPPQAVEENPTVQKAKQYGHVSREDWIAQGKDPDDWKSPKEFVRTGEILDQLYSLRKEISQRDNEIQSLVDYNRRVSEREYERAKQELHAQLQNAKNYDDVESVEHLTRQIGNLEYQEQQERLQSLNNLRQNVMSQFMARNGHWYNNQHPELVQKAQMIGNELKQYYPNLPIEEAARRIEERMKLEHPEIAVSNPAVPKPVLSSSNSALNQSASVAKGGSAEAIFNRLPKDLKDVYHSSKRTLEKIPGVTYTINEYIDKLKSDGEI